MEKVLKTSLLASTMVLLAGATVACGGSDKPAESAYDAQEPSPPPASFEGSDDGAEDAFGEESEAEDSGEEGSGEPASAADFQQALQLVLQDDAMRTALNLEEPGRFPLKITGSNIPSDIELTMVGQPVEIVSPPEDPKKEAVLVFLKASVQGDTANFKFRYDVEGMRGAATVVRTEGRWELKSSRFSQYE